MNKLPTILACLSIAIAMSPRRQQQEVQEAMAEGRSVESI
jgi:hypothetical protein